MCKISKGCRTQKLYWSAPKPGRCDGRRLAIFFPEAPAVGWKRRRAHIFLPAATTFRTANCVPLDDLAAHLHDVRDGHPLAPEIAVQLLTSDDDLLPELLAAARTLKEQFRPGVITCSRKVFIPLTNLCRDYCGYCTYRRDPGYPGAHTMTPDEVLSIAQQGEKLSCTEALFSLGDKPETLFPEMRESLRRLGYRSTLHYLEAMCELVLRETRLLPHANPGLLSAHWIERLRACNPSLGLMLESTSTHLPQAHPAGRTPDKLPALRLKTIEDAGRLGVPFTTGILIGIGETMHDRVESLLAIKRLHQCYGHIQEVIIQNFRVKPPIPMAAWPEPSTGDMLRTIAVARLLLGDMNIQAPPNLTLDGYERLLDGGINDWGGVSPLTPDYINPEAPWPHLLDLQRRTEAAGQTLKQRLPVYPEFIPRVIARGGLLAERLRSASAT
jgi:7,8-didemethyl-8-hydroxy-5-deazariboflavin synthase CofG subunit